MNEGSGSEQKDLEYLIVVNDAYIHICANKYIKKQAKFKLIILFECWTLTYPFL